MEVVLHTKSILYPLLLMINADKSLFCNKAWHFWHKKLKSNVIHCEVLDVVLHIFTL